MIVLPEPCACGVAGDTGVDEGVAAAAAAGELGGGEDTDGESPIREPLVEAAVAVVIK